MGRGKMLEEIVGTTRARGRPVLHGNMSKDARSLDPSAARSQKTQTHIYYTAGRVPYVTHTY